MSESLSGFEAFIRGLSSWPRLVLNQVLFGLIATGAFILFIVPGIYVTVRLSLMDTVTVLEQQKGTAAVSRSFELTANNFGLVFLVGLVCLLINLSIFGLIALLQNYLPDQFSTWYAEALGSTLFDLQSGFSIMCMLVLWNDLKAESRLAPLQLPVPKQ